MQQSIPTTSQSDGTQLELVRDFSGAKRHCLAGRPVTTGTELELLLDDGTWVRGRYDWSGLDARWPGLRVKLRADHLLDGDRPIYAVLALPPQAQLRWPLRSR